MKKRFMALMLVLTVLALTACGNKKEETVVETVDVYGEEGFNTNILKTELYPEADELVAVPLGTFYNKNQTDYCQVRMPKNYLSTAYYHDKHSESFITRMANGDDVLADALRSGLLDQEVSIQNITLTNPNLTSPHTTITYGVYIAEDTSYDLLLAEYDNGIELQGTKNRAFYYANTSEYAAHDLVVIYELNDKILLQAKYEGPLTETVGIEKIAYNIYNAVMPK